MNNPEKQVFVDDTGKRLKEERIINGYTQQDVADWLGMGLDNYKRMESGKRGTELWRIQKLNQKEECKMDLIYVVFGTRKTDTEGDDIEKDFGEFLWKYRQRDTEVREILWAYMNRLINLIRPSK